VGGRRLTASKRNLFFSCSHADSGIRSPKDLEGKKVGSRTYRTALTVWARGLLHDRYGVDFSKVQWVLQAKEVFPVHDSRAKTEYVDDKKSMVERLIAGELDAIITDISDTKLFEILETHPVERLVPDYFGEDQSFYRKPASILPYT
jgi:hypothetical protein